MADPRPQRPQPDPAPRDPAPAGAGLRIAVAVARFNEAVTGGLLAGATRALARAGVRPADVTVTWVPGALELPLACRWLAETRRFDAIVALGCVIQGETDHYQHVCEQAARGVVDAGLATSVPIGFGVLTCATEELALARSRDDDANKGSEAAHAALAMVAIRAGLQQAR